MLRLFVAILRSSRNGDTLKLLEQKERLKGSSTYAGFKVVFHLALSFLTLLPYNFVCSTLLIVKKKLMSSGSMSY